MNPNERTQIKDFERADQITKKRIEMLEREKEIKLIELKAIYETEYNYTEIFRTAIEYMKAMNLKSLYSALDTVVRDIINTKHRILKDLSEIQEAIDALTEKEAENRS